MTASGIIRVGPTSNDKCPYKKDQNADTEQKAMRPQAGSGVIPSRAKEQLEPPGTGRWKKEFSRVPGSIWASDFGSPELKSFCHFQPSCVW